MLKSVYEKESGFKLKAAKILSGSAAPVTIGTPISMISGGYLREDVRLKQQGWMISGGIIFSGLITAGTKYSAKHERPYVKYPEILPRSQSGPYSFPSAHTSYAFATATALSFSYPRWYVIAPSYLWAGGVAWSRLYLGLHFPSDILGGIIIGSGSAILAWMVDKHLHN